jgi:hypothetical protein
MGAMPNYPPDTLVIYDGQEMTFAQYQAIVDKLVADFTQKITTSIEELSSLETQMYDHATTVWESKYQLEADMNGIEAAFGTDDNGKKWLGSWQQAWPVIQKLTEACWASLGNYGQNLHLTGDMFVASEQTNLDIVNALGFDFHALDPRLPPPGSSPPPLPRRAIDGPQPF